MKSYKEQVESQDQSNPDQVKREGKIRNLNRDDRAHLHFTTCSESFAPQEGQLPPEVNFMSKEHANRQQKFPETALRIQEIKKYRSLSLYGKLHIVNFPCEVLKEINVIGPDHLSYYYAEPCLSQRFTFTMLILEEYKVIGVHATFHIRYYYATNGGKNN